jgi:tetratricopeptide (TPR) repeat protein
MCLLEYISANKNISPYDLEMLKFDSEVIFLCKEIAGCYLKISDNENAERFKDLGGYFLDILRDNAGKSPEIACEYAYYYYRIKKYGDALRIIDELCPDLDRAKILIAKIHYEKKNYQRIIDILQDFKTNDSKLMTDGFFLLGKALHNLGRFYDALEMFKKVEEMSPDFPLIHYYLGSTAACMNDAHTAKNYLQEAFRRTKNLADIRILLGDTYFVLNEYDEAIKFYEHARGAIYTYEKNKEKETAVIERLSRCYLYKKDFSKAAGALNFIIEEFDREHINAHVKLFLILLITNTTTGDLWDRELSFIKNRQIDVKSVYNRIRGDFPPAIANVIDIDIKGL